MKKLVIYGVGLMIIAFVANALSIESPENTVYTTDQIPYQIPLIIISNVTLDSISYQYDNYSSLLCENCSYVNETLTLEEGEYNLSVEGILGNETLIETVLFSIELEQQINETPGNETPENETEEGLPRFTLGFHKLPKWVINDELTDEELADIINNNNLNPGILNRLIKTGKLGELSIQAILDAEFQPPSIFRKIMSFFGFEEESSSELIYENYNLSSEIEQELIIRDDFPEAYVGEITDKLEKNLEKKLSKQEAKTAKKAYKVGKKEEKIEEKESKRLEKQENKAEKQESKIEKQENKQEKQENKGQSKKISNSNKGSSNKNNNKGPSSNGSSKSNNGKSGDKGSKGPGNNNGKGKNK